jgi:hypothetical protein
MAVFVFGYPKIRHGKEYATNNGTHIGLFTAAETAVFRATAIFPDFHFVA